MKCMLNQYSRVWLFVPPWTIACQAPLFTGFSRQEYWNGLPSPPPADRPDPGIEPTSLNLLHWQVGSLPLTPHGKPFLFRLQCNSHLFLMWLRQFLVWGLLLFLSAPPEVADPASPRCPRLLPSTQLGLSASLIHSYWAFLLWAFPENSFLHFRIQLYLIFCLQNHLRKGQNYTAGTIVSQILSRLYAYLIF